MKVKVKLAQKREAIEGELHSILSRENSPLFQAMRYTVFSGGKRFRPLLALCVGESFDVGQREILPFACALELIHNYSLIHDDLPLMDNDDFRRGKPSSHKVYGEAVALLAGDSLLTLAFEVMAQASLSGGTSSQKQQVIKEISECAGARGMIGGQVIDITLSAEKATEESVNELILKKTGALIIASVKAGAILGKASAFQLEAVVDYGKNIGLAFQIRDDILDSFIQEEKLDIGRANYVSLFGLEESKRRLMNHVEAGIQALNKASLNSEELRYLTLMLSNLERRSQDE